MPRILREDVNKGNKLLQTEGKKNNNFFFVIKITSLLHRPIKCKLQLNYSEFSLFIYIHIVIVLIFEYKKLTTC